MLDVIDRFFSVSARDGESVAVYNDTTRVRFKDLAAYVRKYATLFSSTSAPKVMIAIDHGTDAYAAMLGTIMVGGFYAPVNTAAPVEKIRAICQEFQPTIILANDITLASLSDIAPAAKRCRPLDIQSIEEFRGLGFRNKIAYVIFTSGTTGTPKGVVISNASLSHYINWVVDSEMMKPGDRVSQYTNIAFDISVLDIFGTLCSGAMVVPLTTRSDRLMPALGVRKYGITVWISVPSVIALMMRAKQLNSENLSSIRRFFFAGEPLLETHLRGIFDVLPHSEVWNAYGPTETTVTMTCLKLNSDNYASFTRASVAIGDVIPGMHIRLIGGDEPDAGEIVIGGPQVAEGYWNSPTLTANSFQAVDWCGSSMRAHFSGDWGRRVNGQLYCESRIDFQVKIDGLRVELNEIAAAIRAAGWPEVAVFKLSGKLVAAIETKSGNKNSPAKKQLHSLLMSKLDAYAVPAHYVMIDEFPRTSNDKTDRKAIQEIVRQRIIAN